MSTTLHYQVTVEEHALLQKAAKEYGTPLYVYSLDRIDQKRRMLLEQMSSLQPELRYALKANANPHILQYLRSQNVGVDVVSLGEYLLAEKLGFKTSEILVTVNNISREETRSLIERNALLNIGSLSALKHFAEDFPGHSLCLRFNPDVIDGAHERIQTGGDATKFGLLLSEIEAVLSIVHSAQLRVVGLHEHTGSGIKKRESFLQAASRLVELAIPSQFPDLEFLDFGGGFAVPYRPEESSISFQSFAEDLSPLIQQKEKEYGRKLKVLFEPGKFLVAEAGFLLSTLNTIKENRTHCFAGGDSGFSQLIRPVLYEAYHHVIPLRSSERDLAAESKTYDIVGNICETGDYLAKDRNLPLLSEGDILLFFNAGAYGMSMASEYNLRPLPGEAILHGSEIFLSRPRKSSEEFITNFLKGFRDVLPD